MCVTSLAVPRWTMDCGRAKNQVTNGSTQADPSVRRSRFHLPCPRPLIKLHRYITVNYSAVQYPSQLCHLCYHQSRSWSGYYSTTRPRQRSCQHPSHPPATGSGALLRYHSTGSHPPSPHHPVALINWCFTNLACRCTQGLLPCKRAPRQLHWITP